MIRRLAEVLFSRLCTWYAPRTRISQLRDVQVDPRHPGGMPLAYSAACTRRVTLSFRKMLFK